MCELVTFGHGFGHRLGHRGTCRRHNDSIGKWRLEQEQVKRTKKKKKTRRTVDDIPTTTDVPRNHCRCRNRNQPNISPLSKNKKWCSVNKFFYGTWTTPSDLCDRLEPSFFAGIVSPTTMTATAESPALERHFVFTIKLENVSLIFFKFD